MKTRTNRTLALLAAACITTQAWTGTNAEATAKGQPEMLGGPSASIQALPRSELRKDIERLPAPAQARAAAWMKTFRFPKADANCLHANHDGSLHYACEFSIPEGAATAPVEVVNTDPSAVDVAVSPFPTNLIFHSKPGSTNVLYLDFDGELVTGTVWFSSNYHAVAFSTDENYASFSPSEQQMIKDIWKHVAEDFAAFDVNVTTERPANMHNRVAHGLITKSIDANGFVHPYSYAGGVAFVGVFGWSDFNIYRPVWMFYENLGYSASYIAEATSHEFGHNFGLSHDGTTNGVSYYSGHGEGDTSWSSIMGVGYYVDVSQWSRGEYHAANNLEDDLVILAQDLGYRADDHSNIPDLATALVVRGGTNVVSTTPENDPRNTNTANKGIIHSTNDVDWFRFTAPSGAIDLVVSPLVITGVYHKGGNLDVRADLYDNTGVLLGSFNPVSNTFAAVRRVVPAGTYMLQVRGTGMGNPTNSTPTGYTAYSSIGQYFINGRLGGSITYTSAYSAMTVAGTFNGWNQALANMRLVGDGIWQADLNLANQSSIRFKFVANGSWTSNWGDLNQSDRDLPIAGQTAEFGNVPDITVNGTLNGLYRFTFNEATRAYTLEATPPQDTDGDGMPDAWETQYGLNPNNAADATQDPDGDGFNNLREFQRGSNPNVFDAKRSAYTSIAVAGTHNGWNAAANNLVLVDDYVWQGDLPITASGFRFKFTANGSWAVNFGEQNQSSFNIPVFGVAEQGNFGDIVVNGSLNGTYRFVFSEQTRQYSVSFLPPVDTDGDGMPDAWETQYGLDPNNAWDKNRDEDADFWDNIVEYQSGTNPRHRDTDFDSLIDSTDPNPLVPQWTQVKLSPQVIGTVNRYGGYDAGAWTYSFITNYVGYYTGYRDYNSERGYLRFDMSGMGPARVRNVVLLYKGSSYYNNQMMSFDISALGVEDPRTAPSNTFLAIDAATNRMSAAGQLPANSGFLEAQPLSPALQAALQSRPNAAFWALGLFSQVNSYNGFGWSMSNLQLVVTYEPLRSSYNAMTVAGTFNGWNAAANNMRLVADNTWQWETDFANATGVRFKLVANSSWNTNFGEQNQTAFQVPMTGFAELGNFGDIVINGTLNGRYRFTFNDVSRSYTVEKIGGPPASNFSAMTLAGTFNGWNAALNNMTLVSDYTWQMDFSLSNVTGARFKFVANSSWSTNFGEQNQSTFTLPLSGIAEQGDFGDIVVNGTMNGNYRAIFNEQTRSYTVTQLP